MFEITQNVIEINKEAFEVTWTNLNYSIENNWLQRIFKRFQGFHEPPKRKTILKGINGSIKSGELVAFIGPSGAGKSTLLECIVGRRNTGRTGEVSIYSNNLKSVKMSFISQKNEGLLRLLTVRESIWFAAQLQLASKKNNAGLEDLLDENGDEMLIRKGGSEYCNILTDGVIKVLGLEDCKNNRLPSCSGGQLKRLAIAQQLVAKPRIMVLDEPTSGLDSSSCFQVIDILKKMTQITPQIAVLATIHQPSYKILNMFNKVCIIARDGECIYEGPPKNLVNYIKEFGVICPANYNPAELMIDVACGEYGQTVIDKLAKFHRYAYSFEVLRRKKKTDFSTFLEDANHPTLSHVLTLCERNFLLSLRNPFAFTLRFLSIISVTLFMLTIFGSEIGRRGGCPPDFNAQFEPSELKKIASEIEAEMTAVFNNLGNTFFTILFIATNALLPTCLSFPGEMISFRDEKANHWYSMRSFFLGKLAAEIPLNVLLMTVYTPLSYFSQNQPAEFWRFFVVYIILNLTQLIAVAIGYITGAIFMNNIPASVFLGPTIIIPLVMFTGVFVKIKTMAKLFTEVTYISYLRFSFEGVVVALYGFNRCGANLGKELIEGKEAFIIWMSAMIGIYDSDDQLSSRANTSHVDSNVASEKFVEELIDKLSGSYISENNEVRSAVMNVFEFEDWFLKRALIFLVFYIFFSLFVAYFVIYKRSKIDN